MAKPARFHPQADFSRARLLDRSAREFNRASGLAKYHGDNIFHITTGSITPRSAANFLLEFRSLTYNRLVF
jgi:hypothetical protein